MPARWIFAYDLLPMDVARSLSSRALGRRAPQPSTRFNPFRIGRAQPYACPCWSIVSSEHVTA
jgi:hypothetical protein